MMKTKKGRKIDTLKSENWWLEGQKSTNEASVLIMFNVGSNSLFSM